MTTRAANLFLGLLAALAVVGSAPAGATRAPTVVRLDPVADVALPFWCDWGYDWEERCYRDDGDRLAIGGDEDKVWRAALRFSVAAIPAGSSILEASLRVRHDTVCLGPRKTTRPCRQRPYALDLHPITVSDWFDEREVEFGPAISRVLLADATRPDWLTWDVTALVEEWHAGDRRNDGVLVKLVDAEEGFGVGGPKLPSSTFSDPWVRPSLDVTYLEGGGG